VTQPVSSGIGGGGFALVWDAKAKAVTVLDFRETAPIGIRLDDYAKRPVPEKKRGVMTGVPGEVAGLFELHARWGKRAFAEDVRPAADAAEKGFPLSAHMARALRWNDKWLLAEKRYRLFGATGGLAAAGDVIKNPALSATLRRIAAEGKSAFYEGEIAKDVLATAREAGSRMVAEDLEGYRVVARAPLTARWEGNEVFTMPPPSGGGLMVIETLRTWSGADLSKLGYGSGAYLHALAESFRGAVADRARAIGDPGFVRADMDRLVDPARMRARRAKIADGSTTPAEKFTLGDTGTQHMVVADGDGNVVSITTTVNDMFGARLAAQGGFVLNDELADFATAAEEDRFGISRGPNAPRGGARPCSSMTPTIVVKDGVPVLALGGSGGTRIATGVTQVLLANLAFGRPPADAIADPRVETPPLGGLLLDASGASVVDDLRKRGEVVDTSKPNFSAVQAIAIGAKDGARTLDAAGDPRKGGAGLVE
jgi:gamma-glutamyltranspeptidase/glutathione hydrolase